MRLGLLLASVAALAACNFTANAQRNDSASYKEAGENRRSYDVAGFDEVGLAGPHQVIVTVGAAHSVTAEGSAGVLDRLRIYVEDRDLKIEDEKKTRNWDGKHRPATIRVTLPAIKAAAIGGSGDIRIDKVNGETFAAAIGGSGNIDVQSLTVRSADFSIAGSGDIRAAGRAAKTNVSIAGSGDVAIEGLDSQQASVSVVGSGNAHVRATSAADVSIMGSGDVRVAGGGKCNVSKMGSGAVHCDG